MPIRNLWQIVRDQRPLTMPATATVREACEQMRDRRVGSVLVVDTERRLLGIFTGRDAICRVLAKAMNPERVKLSAVMTPNPATMHSGSTAVDALHLMEDGGFRHVPVVMDGKVFGVVSRGDVKGLELARLDEDTGFWERR